jgi:hypothetical protein
MKKILSFTTIFLLVLSSSCLAQTFHMTGRRQPGYSAKPERIYVMVIGSLNTDDFSDGLLAGLIREFKKKGIMSDGLDGFEKSKETQADFAKGISDFKPEVSLTVRLDELNTYTDKKHTGAKFALTLADGKTGSEVWTGELTITGRDITGDLYNHHFTNSAVKAIIARLTADGIVN